jgi:hypothetical protein
LTAFSDGKLGNASGLLGRPGNSVPKQEDPFKIKIPGPSTGPIKPPPKPKFMAAFPSSGGASRTFRNSPLNPKRLTQFHSLREPRWCFEAVEKVLRACGCTQVQGKVSNSSSDMFKIRCIAVKDGQPTVAAIEIFRLDNGLSAISFKKKSSVDSKRFIAFYEDVYRRFCLYETSGVIDDVNPAGTGHSDEHSESGRSRDESPSAVPSEEQRSSEASPEGVAGVRRRGQSRLRALPPHLRRALNRSRDDTSTSST